MRISPMASSDGPITNEVWLMKSMTLTLLSTPFSRKLFSPVERTPLAENPPFCASRAPGSATRTPGRKPRQVGKHALAAHGQLAHFGRVQIGALRGVLGLQQRRGRGDFDGLGELPTGRVRLTPMRSPAVTTTFSCATRRKPCASAVTV